MTVIKKYPNRRLYDTSRSSYVNLEQVAERVRAGDPIRVVDAKDGTDRTKEVLLQILLEVLQGADLLPVGMLRRLIRATGTGPVERMLRHQLATGLELMSVQLDRMEALFPPVPPVPPEAAASPGADPTGEAPEEPASAPGGGASDVQELERRLAELERRLSRR